ncbi:hypothetical protein EJB05_22193 [Eragrostis curvula]|uniref:Uncharacterized protein n=1 Tax=Eragrostis curvula TaxID=38414 RepID=A0A5J9V3M6_9POAL|nr:hypothetical protein EJB05_22193 [Eragrostis curvula]
MESLTSPWSPAMLPDLTHPWSPPALPELLEPSPELLELFWPSMEQQEQMIDDLLDLESAVGHGPQKQKIAFFHLVSAEPRDALAEYLAAWLRSSSPAWRAHAGRDHFLVAGRIAWDFRRAEPGGEWCSRRLHLPEGRNVTALVLEDAGSLRTALMAQCAVRAHGMAHPQFTDADLDELVKDLAELLKEACVLTLGVWGGRRQRKCRMRRTSWKVIRNISGFQKPFACGHRKYTRKNNPHWTADEVDMLVDGLLRYGVGSWTKIKNAYFDTSIRTPVHLKDKWKNLREACGPEVRSKKKVKPQKATQNILQRMKGKIIKIETHTAQQRRA